MAQVDDAQLLASLGWPVFPCKADKRPDGDLVPNGFKDGSTNPRQIKMWWKVRPNALVGVALPPGTMAVDVDDRAAFAATGLTLPDDAPYQDTPRGGFHALFKTGGQHVKQTIKEHPGMDTRVGGKGYVICYEVEAFAEYAIEDLQLLPDWLVGDGTEDHEARPQEEDESTFADEELLTGSDGTTRDHLTTFAGRLRWAGATGKEIAQALMQAQLDGRIIDGRPDYPWTEKDFVQIGMDFGRKPGADKPPAFMPGKKKRPASATGKQRVTADALMKMQFQPLVYLIDQIFTEGMGIIAGAPKVGKSWLALQAAIAISSGCDMLGRPVVNPRPVLYYGLEDGQRRLQSRIGILAKARPLDLSWLELRWEAPAQGDGLEEEIIKWLDDNMEFGAGVVIIDVLAKIRPPSKGKGTAYDEDYSILGPLQTVVRERPGSALVLVTHDRKAGSEDFLTTITGSRGISGAADWLWVVKRDRLQTNGVINITGRDIEHEQAIEATFAGGEWIVDTRAKQPGRTDIEKDILQALLTEDDMIVVEIINYFESIPAFSNQYLNDETDVLGDPQDLTDETKAANAKQIDRFQKQLKSMEAHGLVVKNGHVPGSKTVIWHAITDEERAAALDAAREAQASAMPQGIKIAGPHKRTQPE